MQFSIIIPTFNEEKFIGNCINSVLAQNIDRSEYEIIVSDASSSDKTRSLAQAEAVVVITQDRGISLGRNRGAGIARGDIFVFADADVMLDREFLSQCREVFSDPSVIGMTGIAHPNDGGPLQRLVYTGTYLLVRFFQIFGLSLFPGLCVAYRRKQFNDAGGFREDFGIVEDLDLSRRISRLGKCRVNGKAKAFVSTRRLEKHLLSSVLFHIYCDLKYLITGKAPAFYPKTEEIRTGRDIWRQLDANKK